MTPTVSQTVRRTNTTLLDVIFRARVRLTLLAGVQKRITNAHTGEKILVNHVGATCRSSTRFIQVVDLLEHLGPLVDHSLHIHQSWQAQANDHGRGR